MLVGFVEEQKFRLDRISLPCGLWRRRSEDYADFFYQAMCGDGRWGGCADNERRCDGAEEETELRQGGHCDCAS